MKTKLQIPIARWLPETVATGIAQPATDFVSMPDLTNKPRYCFG